MKPVGFSTGCLYLSDLSMEKRISLYKGLGAEAIELGFLNTNELLSYQPSNHEIEMVRSFKYVSIHAPARGVTYADNPVANEVIEKLVLLWRKIPFEGIALHPDTVGDFTWLNKIKLPFLIENMDSKKKYGTKPDDLEKIARICDFGFLLDVQHAYEHDPSMMLARDLVGVMGKRLKQMHVSGQHMEEMHYPLFNSDNKNAVARFLVKAPDVPKIGEGILLGNYSDSARKELDFLRTGYYRQFS